MRAFICGMSAVLVLTAVSEHASAESYQQVTRQAVYEAQSRRYVADRTRHVTPRISPRVNPSSQRLVYVDRSTRYDGHVYSGYGNRTQARVNQNHNYATPATVTYVQADGDHSIHNQLVDGESRRVVVVQPNTDNHKYASYARYKHGRSYSGYGHRARSYASDRDYYPQVVYQANYHRPARASYGYGHGYRGHSRHGYYNRHHYGYYPPNYGYRCGSGSYGHFGYHRSHHRSHTRFSVHFRF